MPAGVSAADRKTGQTRVWEDQIEKLIWLYRLKGIRSAEFIGPRIAADLDAEYEAISPLVKKLQKQES